MKKISFQKAALIGGAALIVLILALFWLVRDVWQYSVVDVPHAGVPLYPGDNLQTGGSMQATVPAGLDRLDTITVWPHVQGAREGQVTLVISQNGAEIARYALDASEFAEYEPFKAEIYAALEESLPTELTFSADTAENAEAVLSFYCSKLENASENTGLMTLDYYGVRDRDLTFFWIAAACLFAAYVILCFWIGDCLKKNRKNFFIFVFQEIIQYYFLLSRLVSRDFNTKYRQSALGVVWSVLNPLLTTLVMFLVFSQLFRNNIEHYIVYLLCGIILWNFFSDASGVGLESITSNAPIINKVYVPRYIFPLAKVTSAFVNLLLSLIPLALVVLVSGVKITKAVLLMPIPLAMLYLFTCGVSLLLATSHVFFRDMQFLWGVVRMMWTYLTPIFYSEDIIPARLIHLYHMNPMYQFIYFFRCLVLDGVSPQPIIYLYSTLAWVVPLILGIAVFRKHQNKFALYL